MQEEKVKITANKNVSLVIRNAKTDIASEGEHRYCMSANVSGFSVLSKVNALVSVKFNLFSNGEINFKLGQQNLLTASKGEQSLYFAVSPGDNKVDFEYTGSKIKSLFKPDFQSSLIFDFFITKPALEILAE